MVGFFLEPGHFDLAINRNGDRVCLLSEGHSVTIKWVAFQQTLAIALERFLTLHTGTAEDHLWTWPFPFDHYNLLQSALVVVDRDGRRRV